MRASVGSVPRLAHGPGSRRSLQTIKTFLLPIDSHGKKREEIGKKLRRKSVHLGPRFFRPVSFYPTPNADATCFRCLHDFFIVSLCCAGHSTGLCECINRSWNRIWRLEQRHLAGYGTLKITHFSFISDCTAMAAHFKVVHKTDVGLNTRHYANDTRWRTCRRFLLKSATEHKFGPVAS